MMLNSEYWQNRYATNDVSWDIGVISTPIKEYIDQITNPELKILIPGCGNGYEFEYLLQNNFHKSYVLDYAKEPLNNLRERLPNLNDSQIIQADFFEHSGEYDLIIEQTFFCALSPHLRKEYVQKMKSLLAKNGKIVGLLFQFPLTEKGPPFGGSRQEYLDLFENDFYIKILETTYNSIKPRQGNELFFIFEKK